MTITLDASTAHGSSSGNSTSFSHTIGITGVNTVLFVLVGFRGGTIPGLSCTCTYNGVSMTNLGEKENTSGSPDLAVICFYLIKPSTGANTVALSWTGTAYAAVVARSYYNVSLASPVRSGSFTSGSGTSASSSLSVPSLNGDVVLDVLQILTDSATPSEGAGQSVINKQDGNYGEYSTSYELATSTSTTMSWTFSSYPFAHAAFSIRPVGGRGGVAVSPFLSI